MAHDDEGDCLWIVSSRRFGGVHAAGALRCIRFLDDGTRAADDGAEDLDSFIAYCAESSRILLE